MTQIELQHDIPLRGRQPKSKYPWAEMQVGDSFVLKDIADPVRMRANLMNSAVAWSNAGKGNFHITTEIVGGTITIWRVKKSASRGGKPRSPIRMKRLAGYIPDSLHAVFLNRLKKGGARPPHGAIGDALTEAIEDWLKKK